jgi:hypothetical protein
MRACLFSLLLVAAPVHAEFFDGNKLLSTCRSNQPIDMADCIGYVTGVYDTLAGVRICSPDGITRGQVRDIVLTYLQNAPEERHKTADVLIGNVLSALWPCKRPAGRGV